MIRVIVGFREQVFYIQYYYFEERYFSDLSGFEGGDYLDTGRGSSSRGSGGRRSMPWLQ